MATLAEIDALRDTDRSAALEGYAALQDRIAVNDAERILWLADQVAPPPPPELGRLFARVSDAGDAPLRRAAEHAQATIAWFAGRREEAELRWSRCMHAADRDRVWIRTCLSLSMALGARGCLFEPVVLSGLGARAAADLGEPYLEAYAAFARASLLLDMGDTARAEAAARDGSEAAAAVRCPGRGRVVAYMRFDVRADLHQARGALDQALLEREKQLAWLKGHGAGQGPVLAEVHGRLLALRYELEPSRRRSTLAAIARLPDTYRLGPGWAGDGLRDLLLLRLRDAVERGAAAEARKTARSLLDDLAADRHASRRVRTATRVALSLAPLEDDEGLARKALELASQASLLRILVAARVTREIPALAHATTEDWEILRAYREHLRAEQQAVLETVATVLEPGVASLEFLVEDGSLSICAWCQGVRTAHDTWLPLAHYVPTDTAFAVSHGICPACVGQYFDA
ncbi:MAG: hypothetical protein AAGH15_17310 [Myxococcota bacterium]